MLLRSSAAASLLQAGCSPARRYASSKRGSSGRWLARQKSDPFVRDRARRSKDGDSVATAYVSRSAFKLEQLDAKHSLLRPGLVIVDLGAAPGGWTQVAVERCTPSTPTTEESSEVEMERATRIWALDRLALDPVAARGAVVHRGDFLDTHVQLELEASIGDKIGGSTKGSKRMVDLVLSDMMANTSGNPIRDRQASVDLLEAAFSFAVRNLRFADLASGKRGSLSTLVLKYFESPEAQDFRRDVLRSAFNKVAATKVAASRSESSEMYLVASGLKRDSLFVT